MSTHPRFDIYRVADDGKLIRATHPNGEPAFRVGAIDGQKDAESDALAFAAAEPGACFVVVERASGEELYSVRVQATRLAA